MVSHHDVVFISVSTGHVLICRYHERPDGTLTVECAANAKELEAEAVAALADAGKALIVGGYHPCPPQLAARAKWA